MAGGRLTAGIPAEITDLLRFYGADLADIERLASLAGRADRQTWWAPWTEVLPDWLRTFVGFEGLASTVSDYATFGVPALRRLRCWTSPKRSPSPTSRLSNGAVYVQDQDQVTGYTRIVTSLREVALSPADTVEAIRACLTALT